MYNFKDYWKRFCPTLCKKEAIKMYNDYLEAANASTDMNNYVTVSNATTTSAFDIWSNPVYFAPIPQQACTVPCAPVPKCTQKKEKTMYVDNDKHIESSKINYLSDRANSVFYKKADELPKQFGLSDDAAPRSVSEFVKRIQDGKFMYKDETKKDTEGYFYRPYEGIRWRDPSVKEDNAGHKAAYEALSAAYQDTKDTIAIGTPAEGLAAVKTLEAWTPTVGKA